MRLKLSALLGSESAKDKTTRKFSNLCNWNAIRLNTIYGMLIFGMQ
jgi:hypothetical protein